MLLTLSKILKIIFIIQCYFWSLELENFWERKIVKGKVLHCKKLQYEC